MRCLDCDHQRPTGHNGLCEDCEQERIELGERLPPPRLSRQEQLQLMADNGIDTWEDYRGEK